MLKLQKNLSHRANIMLAHCPSFSPEVLQALRNVMKEKNKKDA